MERNLSNLESQINSAKNDLSNEERNAEDRKRKVKELAAEGVKLQNQIPLQGQVPIQSQSQVGYYGRKNSGSVHSDST
jgi:hypothetical protein